MNKTDKLLKSEKIGIISILIMLVNISLWLLGAFYSEQMIGLAFAMWYPTIFIMLYLNFILLPEVEIEEYRNKMYAPIIKENKDSVKLALSMFEEAKDER